MAACQRRFTRFVYVKSSHRLHSIRSLFWRIFSLLWLHVKLMKWKKCPVKSVRTQKKKPFASLKNTILPKKKIYLHFGQQATLWLGKRSFLGFSVFEDTLVIRDHPFSTYAKLSKKLTSYSLIRTRT